jgi:coenzyme F420-reducing hydrogenase gamma subunit
MAGKRLKVGWFSFTCCEDSTMIWIEMMNQRFFEWKKLIDIRHARVLKKNNILRGLDVAFVEGAITNEADAKKLQSIRKNSKRLVAIGACAVNGMPAGQRNAFDEPLKEEIAFLLKRFRQADRVRMVKEVVAIDAEVPGCPMEENVFLDVLGRYLKEFGVSDAQVR